MTDHHHEAATTAADGGPSGYTPLDDLKNGGAVSSVLMASTGASASGVPNEPGEAEAHQQQPPPPAAAATFILAPSNKPDVEPEGWSDYSDDDNGEPNSSMMVEGEGAFFADMAAFSNQNEEEEAHQEEADGHAPGGYAPLSMSGGPDDDGDNDASGDEDFDFRAIADQALRALDDEYLGTVQMQQERAVVADNDDDVDDDDDDDCGGAEEVLATDDKKDNDKDEGLEHAEATTTDVTDAIALPSKAKEHPNPPIDNDAVRKAMETMRLKSPDLANTLDAGAEQRLDPKYRLSLAPTLVPDVHGIIPPTPLKAFRKMTSKAVSASANLSRSATISEALVRCLPHLLLPQGAEGGTKSANSRLVIHVVGSDYVECRTEETVRAAVGPLVRWIESACSSNVSDIDIHLLGPNVPIAAERRGLVDLSSPSTDSGVQSATARCINCVYHDYLRSEEGGTPDLAVAFNAGCWGYNEWRPTLEVMCNHDSAIPFVITAYTVQEAEDDAEVVTVVTEVAANAKACCLWSAEINPFGSRKKRETASAAHGREYRENGAWQAWRLGGTE